MYVLLRAGIQPFLRQHRLDDVLHNRFAQMFLIDIRIVLRGQHYCIDTGDAVIFVAKSDLTFGIRAQPGKNPFFAHLGLPLYQAMCISYRRRHQYLGFVCGITEHQALVASPLLFRITSVHSHGDVAGLFTDQRHHRASLAVKTDVRAGVADVADHPAYYIFQVHPSVSGDFSSHDHGTGLDQGLAGDPGVLVLVQNGVENRVGYLVRDLIRVTFRDRL